MRHVSVLRGDFHRTTQLRATLLSAARKWFTENSFLEISVPHITGATGSCEWFPNAMPVKMYNAAGDELEMFLRQTGQLYLEAFTQAHNRVYTIGTSFRQERKVTNRHLCEFTLIEFEGRDFELDGLMDLIEGLLKAMYGAAREFTGNELLDPYVNLPFNRIEYAAAIELLQQHGYTIFYGDDLGSTEELAICEILDRRPTLVTMYPADPKPQQGGVIKFFSMKRRGEQTLCCDLLLPQVGESVGGAVREGHDETCRSQFQESYMFDHLVDAGVDPAQFDWYFEVLKNGQGHSSGCGIGFERVIQSVLAPEGTGLSIKAAVELPRAPDFLMP